MPDVIASTANFMQHLGWQRGQPWLQEVRVPGNLPWDQADLAIQHPRSQVGGAGASPCRDGRPLPADAMPASLLLPMGRLGPAFLAYPELPGLPAVEQLADLLHHRGPPGHAARRRAAHAIAAPGRSPSCRLEETKELQQLLVRRGYDVGEIDGKLGAATRAGVKGMQMKLGLPADSYPTAELIDRLRGAR